MIGYLSSCIQYLQGDDILWISLDAWTLVNFFFQKYLLFPLHFQMEDLFSQYEGTNELSSRLEEFVTNQQSIGKPVKMETILNQIKNVLKKVCC